MVSGLSGVDISLIGSADCSFDSSLRQILDGQPSRIADLEPYLVFVGNHDSRTVVAYSVCFEITRIDGSRKRFIPQFKYPDAIAGPNSGRARFEEEDREIRTGELRLVGTNAEFGPWISDPDWQQQIEKYSLDQARDFADVKDLLIILDAVVFDDGELVGPDVGNLAEHFAAYVKAKQDIYYKILQSTQAGGLFEDAFKAATSGFAVTAEDVAKSPLSLYPKLAADGALVWRDYYGDRVFQVAIKQAIPKEPFVVRRRAPDHKDESNTYEA